MRAADGLGRFVALDRDRGLALTCQALVRPWGADRNAGAAADRLRGEALRLIAVFDLRRGESDHPSVAAALAHLFDHLEEYADPIRHVLHRCSDWLTVEDAVDGAGADRTRERTWRFLRRVANRAIDLLASRRKADPAFDVNAPKDGEKSELAKILENTSFCPYVLAGGVRELEFDRPPADETRRKASVVWRHGWTALELFARSGHRETMFHVLDALVPILRSAADRPDATGMVPVRSQVFAAFLTTMQATLDAGYVTDWRAWNLFDEVIRWIVKAHLEDLRVPDQRDDRQLPGGGLAPSLLAGTRPRIR